MVNKKRKMDWYKVDLHLHTAASHDYHEPHVSYLQILQKAEEKSLDMIAFTDHNTVAGVDAARSRIEDLEMFERSNRLQPDERRELLEYRRLLDKVLVLPGFELTATLGFHILGIFPETTSVRELEHILLDLRIPKDKLDLGSSEVGATVDVLTAYQIIAEAGGLVIAAHANSTHGVAMLDIDFGGQTKIAYTQDRNLHALEVTDLETGRRRTTASFFNGAKPQYPRRMHCIQGSDSHRLNPDPRDKTQLGVGDRVTEVLLPERTFAALKELFLEDDFARTRPYRAEAKAFDYIQAARDQGPNIVQCFHESATRAGGRLSAILRDVVAFANTNGGTIYVGASANAKSPVIGVPNPEEVVGLLRGELQRTVSPRLDVPIDVQKSDGRDIVRLTVPKGTDTPYLLDGIRIYVRQESQTSLAVRDEIIQLVKRSLLQEGAVAPVAPVQAPAAAEAAPKRRPGRERGGAPKGSGSVSPELVAQVAAQLAEERAPEERAAEERATEPAELAEDAPAIQEAAAVLGDAPRTGVEILESEERKGVTYHALRDLRNGNVVREVTRSSARRLWRYAITQKESGQDHLEGITWQGDIALVRKRTFGGRTRYDFAQRDAEGKVHIYYGVSEEGIHGGWRQFLENA
ncbi:MAG: transcriptional regulator [Chloroflexi bacterium]|nr:transcriptional regulator [Chloroflexota bacterium]